MRISWLVLFLASASVLAGPVQSEHLYEAEGWKAAIRIDCYSTGESCGHFEFIATGCQGTLVYRGERDEGYVFQEKLAAGRCVPNCELWISEHLDRYREFCRGKASGGGNLGMDEPPAALPVVRAPAQPAQQPPPGAAMPTIVAPPAPAALPKDEVEQVIRAGDTTYRGKFRVDPASGVLDGNGRVEWTGGNRYEGTVQAGSITGQGRFEWANGDRYTGGMLNAEPHGQGEYVWRNGDRYVGSWRKGQKQGNGRYYFTDGSYWEGEYANDRQTANGRLVWAEQQEKLSTASNTMPVPSDDPPVAKHAVEPPRSTPSRPALQKKSVQPVSPCPAKLVQCVEVCDGLIDAGQNSPAQVCRKRCDGDFAACQAAQ